MTRWDNAQNIPTEYVQYVECQKTGKNTLTIILNGYIIKSSKRGDNKSQAAANNKFEVLPMTIEFKITFTIKDEKKKSPAKATKGKTQSQSQSTVIINQK